MLFWLFKEGFKVSSRTVSWYRSSYGTDFRNSEIDYNIVYDNMVWYSVELCSCLPVGGSKEGRYWGTLGGLGEYWGRLVGIGGYYDTYPP